MEKGSVSEGIPPFGEEETFEVLAKARNVGIERIVSRGRASPPGFWYDQEQDEWVVLWRGEAEVEFAGPGERVALKAGDWLLIPARRRHRVSRAGSNAVWLAVHIYPA